MENWVKIWGSILVHQSFYTLALQYMIASLNVDCLDLPVNHELDQIIIL